MLQSQTLFMHVGQGLSMRVGFPTVASWGTQTRPKKPKRGTIGYNMDTNNLEYWDGAYWLSAEMSKL